MHSLCHSLQTATPTQTVMLQSPLAATLQNTLQSAMKTAMLQTAVKLAMLQKRLYMALLQSTHMPLAGPQGPRSAIALQGDCYLNFACTALGNRVLVRQRLVRCSSRTVLLCLSPTGELCGTAPTARCKRTWVGVGVAKVGRGCQKCFSVDSMLCSVRCAVLCASHDF